MAALSSMSDVETILRETAEELILPRFQALGSAEILEKTGPNDLVTIADQEAEIRLTERLEDLVPGSKVIGEEAVSQGVTPLELLLEDQDMWLVDPVDGTYNFVHGSEDFGVMVAFIRGGKARQAWILMPVDGRCAVAEDGAGASFGGAPMTPRLGVSFAEAHGDYSKMYMQDALRPLFDEGVKRSAGTRQGRCSAVGYTELARGKLDYFLQYIMTPWDHAAGQLIVEEAGGRFAFLPGGEPYTPIPRDNRPMLAVADKDVWHDYKTILMGEA